MALVDLSSDLSKFRSTVKSAGEIKPETSKAKSLRGFAAFQPISEKISSLSPNINKPKSIDLPSKLSSTTLDDVVKKLKDDLIINSVSKYSPVNASKTQSTIGRVSLDAVVSKFSSIRQERLTSRLDKSDVLILKADSGTNNNTSSIDVNMLLAKTFDRKSSSPTVSKLIQTDDKSISSPNITTDSNEEVNNVVNPNIIVNKISLTGNKETQSPDLFQISSTDDKTESSPDIVSSNEITDKSGQSPNVFFDSADVDITTSTPDILSANNSSDKEKQSPSINVSAGVIDKSAQSPSVNSSATVKDKSTQSPSVNPFDTEMDKSSQSPNVLSTALSSDRSKQSPSINNPIQSSDRSAESPSVFSDIQTPDKGSTSPNIKAVIGDQSDNVTDPKTEVFGRPLSIERKDQSALINKDLVSPINNIIDPNIALEKSELSFDRSMESPDIFTNIPLQGLVTNPNTKVFRIEQGTNHLKDESQLNPDGIPLKFVTTSRLANRQPSQLVDDKDRYLGQSNQLSDNSNLNVDGVIKTNPSGRNENPDRSILSVKGVQAVNFFPDRNAKGFTTKVQKGLTQYTNNSEFSWNGSGQSAPTTNFIPDINGKGFTKFPTLGVTLYNNETSKFGFSGKPAVNFLNDSNAAGYTTTPQPLITLYKNDTSVYQWKGNNQGAPEVDYFDSSKTNTSTGFTKFISSLSSKFVDDSSKFIWKGSSRSAPSTNYFSDTSGAGFNTFIGKLESKYTQDVSEFTFKGTLPTPVNFLSDTNGSGFTNKPTMMETKYTNDSSRFVFGGNSRKAPSVNFIQDRVNSGFTNFPQQLNTEFKVDKSQFTFKGNRQQAPSVNYFTDNGSTGFTKLPIYLESELKPKSSRFTWVGNRQQAPEVDFFSVGGANPKAIKGFTKFFIDRTQNKVSDQYSSLSFAGTSIKSAVRPVPYTSFFGYTPYEKSGFMVDMTTFDGTLYPNIVPRLHYNMAPGQRYAAQQIRSIGGLITQNNEKYAPKSLGPRPWIDGTLSSTLDSQIPDGQIKTGAKAGSYLKKYETALKEGTNGLGFVTKWATTRRSPSPLDNQYNKYKLQKESVNSEPAFFFQPYIVRGIQRDGEVENQRWGFGVTFDDGLVRGGIVTQVERILADTIRLSKWTLSVKGLMFNIKQVGLQLMNPNVDINPSKSESGILGLSATQAFNPLSIIANIPSARAGLHLPRHGLIPFSRDYLNRYEDATIARENKSKFIDPEYKAFEGLTAPTFVNRQTDYNRLIGLMKELLPNSFKPVVASDVSSNPAAAAAAKVAIELAKKLTGQTGITRLSSNFGGPQSMLGIGGTQINRASHPYLTAYTTTPLLMLTGELKEPQYPTTAKKDTFYSATTMYRDLFGDVLKTIAYNLPKGPYELNDENLPRQKNKIQNIQPITRDRIEKQNPFEPKYDLFKNRLRAVTSFDVQRSGDLSNQVNPDNSDQLNPIKQYRALSYDKLGVSRDRRRSRNGTTNTGDVNDFRADLVNDLALNTFSTDPDIVDYATQNLQDKFGFGKHGKANVPRNKPFQNTISYGKSRDGYAIPIQKEDTEFRGDRINIIDYKRAKFDISRDLVYEKGKYKNGNLPGTDDLIEFYFTGVVISGTNNRPAEAIVFRATFGNIRDSHNADWSPIKYMGRGDPLYVYQGYDREISFDFVVQITSRDEMKASWRKLNHLASWTAPQYNTGGFIRGPIIRLNIGNLYRKMPGFLSNISYDFDNTETTWETAQLRQDQDLIGANGQESSPGVLQLPKTIRVSCAFTPIGVYRPEYNGVMYSLYDDTAGGNLENGLIPNNDIKVNYFKTFDVDETGKKVTFDTKENMDYHAIKPGDESIIPKIDETNRESMVGEQTPQNRDSVNAIDSTPVENTGTIT